MAQTTTVVAKMALGLLGSKTIEDIDSTDDDLAVDCKFWLEQSIREMGVHPWNPLARRISLAQESTGPAFGYDYQYRIPNDCMLVIRVNGYEENAGVTPTSTGDSTPYREPYWVREGRFILTDDEVCKIQYVKYIDTTSEMNGAFISALACLMASYLAPKIRNDGGKRGDELRMRYDKILLPRARMVDSNERKRIPAEIMEGSRFLGYRKFGTAYRSPYGDNG